MRLPWWAYPHQSPLEVGPPTAPWSQQSSPLYNKLQVAATDASSALGVDRYTGIIIFIKTANVTGTTPTLNAILQTLMADNTTWADIGAFTQITNATAKVMGFMSGGSAEYAQTDGSLAAGTIKAVPLGRLIRVKFVIGGTNPKFDISCYVGLLQ